MHYGMLLAGERGVAQRGGRFLFEREGADWVFLLLECSAPDKASVFICLAMGQPPLSCLLQIALFVLMEACCSQHKVSEP